MDPLGSVRETISRLLAGIDSDARVTELAVSPDGEWYTIRLHVPGTISKPIEVPKAVVQGTPLSPESLRTLGHMLRVEVRRSRIAGDRPLEVLVGPQPDPPGHLSPLLDADRPRGVRRL